MSSLLRYQMEENLSELQRLFMHYHDLDRSPESVYNKNPEFLNVIDDAVLEMKALPEYQTVKPLSVVRLKKLGMERKTKEETKNTMQMNAVRAISGLKRAFSIAYRVTPDKKSECLLGLEGDENGEILAACLRSAFGQAELEILSPQKEYQLQFHENACCMPYSRNKKSEEQGKAAGQIIGFVDAAACAMPHAACEVTMHFVPLQTQWIEGQKDKLHKKKDLLEEMAEISWQAAMSEGSNVTTVAGKFETIKESLTESRKESPNSGVNVSLSTTFRRSLAEMAAEDIEFQLDQLSDMLSSGGWSIFIKVQAERKAELEIMKGVVSGALGQSGISSYWSKASLNRMVKPSLILESNKLHLVFRFPEKRFPGFQRVENREYAIDSSELVSDGSGIQIGNIMWNEHLTEQPFSVSSAELNRHVFVCGMTGSGKTNTVCSLLLHAGLPFFVIEPVKGEYRSLGLPNTEVYTMEAESSEALMINPFCFPKGSRLRYHIDSLRAIISSAFDLYAAMPNILEQCLIRVYMNMGWDLITSKNVYQGKLPDEMLYPTFSQLCDEIEHYLESSEFEGETQANYKGAMLSRLQSFTTGSKGLILNQSRETPFEDWFDHKKNVIIELDDFADDADKCIVMGILLTQYFQYIKCCVPGTEAHGIRHLIVLEEAHHLFMADTESSNGSDSRKQLVETLNNMLAEIREYGEGVIVVDQSPSRVSEGIIKNTGTKIVHRVDFGKDMEILRSALLLDSEDKVSASLNRGTALVRYGQMEMPAKVAISLCEQKEKFVLEKKKGNGPNNPSVRSIAETILVNTGLCRDLEYICQPFINQVLFDDFTGSKMAVGRLQKHCARVICEHGYKEFAATCDINALISIIVMKGIRKYLEITYKEQYFFHKIFCLFIESLLEWDESGQACIRKNEYDLLRSYRKFRIYPLLETIYACSWDPEISEVLRVCNAKIYYAGLLKNMLKELKKREEEKEFCEKTWDEKIKEIWSEFFYEKPEKFIAIEIEHYLQQCK